jgi:hypothetical protein
MKEKWNDDFEWSWEMCIVGPIRGLLNTFPALACRNSTRLQTQNIALTIEA